MGSLDAAVNRIDALARLSGAAHLDPENRARIQRLLEQRMNRVAALEQHGIRWPGSFDQLDAVMQDHFLALAEHLEAKGRSPGIVPSLMARIVAEFWRVPGLHVGAHEMVRRLGLTQPGDVVRCGNVLHMLSGRGVLDEVSRDTFGIGHMFPGGWMNPREDVETRTE